MDKSRSPLGQEESIRHVLTKPIMLHSDVVLVLHVYKLNQSTESWANELYLHENQDFHEMLASSARETVRLLAPNACAHFWIELSKAIKAEVEGWDEKCGSDHSRSVVSLSTSSERNERL